jgi:hypothetical protein
MNHLQSRGLTRAPLLAALAVALLLLVLILGWAGRSMQVARRPAPTSPAQSQTPAVSMDQLQEPADVAVLLDPAGSAAGDVEIIAGWLDVLLTAVPVASRPPLADNADITRLLLSPSTTGRPWLPGSVNLVDAQGRFLDRHGTPYHFHQESSTRLTVRSAGPDKRLFTPDDAVAPRGEQAADL